MTVRWTKPAADDLIHVCDYTEERFGTRQARRAARAVYGAADSLRAMPHLGRNGRVPGPRELTVPGLPFLLVYRAGPEAIEILRVLHGMQQWP